LRRTFRQALCAEDPTPLLQWLGKDRAMIVFADLEDFKVKQDAFEAIIRNMAPACLSRLLSLITSRKTDHAPIRRLSSRREPDERQDARAQARL
jgi:hypothetical protein